MNQRILEAEKRVQQLASFSAEFDENKHPRANDGKFSLSKGARKQKIAPVEDVHTGILEHLKKSENPVHIRDLAAALGHKLADIRGGEDPATHKFNGPLIKLVNEGKIKVHGGNWGEPSFTIAE